jgi:hypothetical protein
VVLPVVGLPRKSLLPWRMEKLPLVKLLGQLGVTSQLFFLDPAKLQRLPYPLHKVASVGVLSTYPPSLQSMLPWCSLKLLWGCSGRLPNIQ